MATAPHAHKLPLRESVLAALEQLGWPATPRELAAVIAFQQGSDIAPQRVAGLMTSEARAHQRGRAYPVWICPALIAGRGEAVARLLTRSDWPLERRVLAPTTARARHAAITARVCALAAAAPPGPARGTLEALAAELARGLPDHRVAWGQVDLATWEQHAHAMLEARLDEDLAARVAAATTVAALGPHERLFGRAEIVVLPQRG